MSETNNHIGREAVQTPDLAGIRSAIHFAKYAIELVEVEHGKISDEMQGLGYRKLISSDFEEFGAIGRVE